MKRLTGIVIEHEWTYWDLVLFDDLALARLNGETNLGTGSGEKFSGV